MQHMVLSISARVRGGLSVHKRNRNSIACGKCQNFLKLHLTTCPVATEVKVNLYLSLYSSNKREIQM
jgi:hypothetical protein